MNEHERIYLAKIVQHAHQFATWGACSDEHKIALAIREIVYDAGIGAAVRANIVGDDPTLDARLLAYTDALGELDALLGGER